MREGEQGVQAGLVVLLAMQLHREMRALAEHAAQPSAFLGIRLHAGAPQREQPEFGIGQQGFHVIARQQVTTLRCRTTRVGDQPAQLRIAGGVFDQQHELQAAGQDELAADDQLQSRGARRLQSAHDAGQRTFVGDRQRLVAATPCAFEQLLRARGAAQEREIRKAVQFRVGGQVVVVGRVVVGGVQAPALRDFPCARHAPARGFPVHAIDGIVPAHAASLMQTSRAASSRRVRRPG